MRFLFSRSYSLTLAVVVAAVTILSGHGLTAPVAIDGTIVEGRIDGDGVVVDGYRVLNNSLDVTAVPNRRVDVLFDPVDLAVGESFTATARDEFGSRLADITLVQTGVTTTDVSVSLAPVLDRLESDIVTLRARSAAGIQTEVVVPAQAELRLGTVDAPTSAWAKTYHVVCMETKCTLAIDPDETTVRFDKDPTNVVPFQFLEVEFSLRKQ